MSSPFSISQAISQNLGQGQKNVKDRFNIDEILAGVEGSNDPQAINNAIMRLSAEVSPDKAQGVVASLDRQLKSAKEEKTKEQNLQIRRDALKALGIDPELAGLPDSVLKEVINPKRDPIEKDRLIKLNNQIDKQIEAGASLGFVSSSLAQMEKLLPEFSGTGNLTQFIPGANSNKAANEFEALSEIVMKPVLELFNPRGVLAQRKVELLRSVLKPNSLEPKNRALAKINAIKALTDFQVNRAARLRELRARKGAYITDEDMAKFDQADEKFIDKILSDLGKAGVENLDILPSSVEAESEADIIARELDL